MLKSVENSNLFISMNLDAQCVILHNTYIDNYLCQMRNSHTDFGINQTLIHSFFHFTYLLVHFAKGLQST